MGQCSLYGVKNKASVLYLNENLPIPVKSGLCYIFLFAVCFFNYLKLVVGGIAGTKKQNYAYSFAMKTYLQDLLQIMDLNTVYCMTNTFWLISSATLFLRNLCRHFFFVSLCLF